LALSLCWDFAHIGDLEPYKKLQKHLFPDTYTFIFGRYHHTLHLKIRAQCFLYLWRTFRFCLSAVPWLAVPFLQKTAQNPKFLGFRRPCFVCLFGSK